MRVSSGLREERRGDEMRGESESESGHSMGIVEPSMTVENTSVMRMKQLEPEVTLVEHRPGKALLQW